MVDNRESKVKELKERVLKFQMLELPGQPMGMHMGTMYLVGDLMRTVEEFADEIKRTTS